jgi:hypothetical protein
MSRSFLATGNRIDHAPGNFIHRTLLLLALLTGFALRTIHLGGESLWYDETVSVYLAGQSLPALIAHTAGDIHPPAYYALLHAWRAVAHPSLEYGLEYLYAWPSLWFGVLILALLYPIGVRLLDRNAALLATWLAAIHPFQLWYSQEVRMYTLGAALGLLCLYAMLKALFDARATATNPPAPLWRRRTVRWLAIYIVAAATGLYTLYYFAMLLIALNVLAFVYLAASWRQGRPNVPQHIGLWILAQGLIFVLWLPWLPTFWRQMTLPPVPAWRTPWTGVDNFAAALVESLAAFNVGQSPPWPLQGLWAGVALAIVAVSFGYTKKIPPGQTSLADSSPTALPAFWTPVAYVLLPTFTILAVSLWLTPIYHVRYLFTYSAGFILVTAAALVTLFRLRRWLGITALLLVMTFSIAAIDQLWTNPLYRADDHRSAVAELARRWRPGDLILVNAGWVYPALTIYWPTELSDSNGALPPPIARLARLGAPPSSSEGTLADVVIVRTGSVDGLPSLGWGRAEADFFPLSAEATETALADLAARYQRLWHYRLYDTVSDPEGRIRAWLESHTKPVDGYNYPGHDFLRVELYETGAPVDSGLPTHADSVEFGDALRLDAHSAPESIQAGRFLYTNLNWTALPSLPQITSTLAMSLRLYGGDGAMVAQADASPLPPTSAWLPGQSYGQALSLPIPMSLSPGVYQLQLLVYQQTDLVPLPIAESPRAVDGQRWILQEITVQPALAPPPIGQIWAWFTKPATASR